MKALETEGVASEALDSLLGYHLRRATLCDLAGFARALDDEITPVPFSALCLIAETPGITAAEIGRRIRLQRANLAPMLAEFDARALIERRLDRDDHRIQRLHLSPTGVATLADWRARIMAQENETFGVLTMRERETLRRLLAKVWQRD